MNKIDIIIPIYNSLNTLERTLISIKKQTIKDKLEIYLIDDCSNDNYDILLNKYNMLNIHYHKLNKNVGPGIARNEGIKISSNKYIYFLDSDDEIFLPNSLEIMYNEIEQGYDLIVSQTKYEKLNQIFYNRSDLHGKLYKRFFIAKNNIEFNETRYHEDNAFHNLVVIHQPKTKFIPQISYMYSHNPQSLTEITQEEEFNNIEILIYNMRYVINEALKKECDITEIKEFIYKYTNIEVQTIWASPPFM